MRKGNVESRLISYIDMYMLKDNFFFNDFTNQELKSVNIKLAPSRKNDKR